MKDFPEIHFVMPPREVFVGAFVVATLSFLFVHHYNSDRSFIANVMQDGIYLDDPCREDDASCSNTILPYRWILVVIIFYIARLGFTISRHHPKS